MTDEPVTEISSPEMVAIIGEAAARVAALVAGVRAGGRLSLRSVNLVEFLAALVVLRIQDDECGEGSKITVYIEEDSPTLQEAKP